MNDLPVRSFAITLELHIPEKATHYTGCPLSNHCTWWYEKDSLCGKYWCSYNPKDDEWYIQGTRPPHFIQPITDLNNTTWNPYS